MNLSIGEENVLGRAHRESLACLLLRKKNQIIGDNSMGAASNSNVIMHLGVLLLKVLDFVM